MQHVLQRYGQREAAQASSSAATTTTTSAVPSATPSGNARVGYPSPTVVSPDGSVAGYFLNGSQYEAIAVLSISAETESEPAGAQKAVSDFLAACREASMAKLIIDVSSNPVGDFVLSYEFFKQVSPSSNAPRTVLVIYITLSGCCCCWNEAIMNKDDAFAA